MILNLENIGLLCERTSMKRYFKIFHEMTFTFPTCVLILTAKAGQRLTVARADLHSDNSIACRALNLI